MFYPMEVDHTTNKRIRLLFNDFNSDGYWIWKCIIDMAYKTYGYYYPATGDDVDLLAADVCRKPPELVWEVIGSCVKRGLFDNDVFKKYAALTNDKMQMNYIRGTYERRRKGTVIYFKENLFLIPESELVQTLDKHLDRVLFTETGKAVLLTLPLSAANNLFSAEKQSISAENNDISADKDQISGRERERERERERYTNTFVDAKASPEKNGHPVIGIKNKAIEETAELGKKIKHGPRRKKFKSLDTELSTKILTKWMSWYSEKNNGAQPNVDKGQGEHAKKISKYFLGQARLDDLAEEDMYYDSAFYKFCFVLTSWEKLSNNQYLYNAVDIKNISSNLNQIINFLNNGRTKTNIELNSSGSKKLGISDARTEANRKFGLAGKVFPRGNQKT